MLNFGKFSLAAPPYVGADFFADVIQSVGIVCQNGFLHNVPPMDCDVFVISIVRHPVSWLFSYFEDNLKSHGIMAVNAFRECYRGSSLRFDYFVQSYLSKNAGGVGRMFDSYKPSSVMRFEDMPYAGYEFLDSFGVSGVPAVEDSRFILSCPWMQDKELRRDVVRAEREFCDRLEYF